MYEGILRSEEGRLLEGMSSNFYAVLNGALYTADEGVLAGITRRAVLEIAAELLPLRPEAPHQRDMPRFTEAFLTSSGRGVVPITRIDETDRAGTPADSPARLQKRYDAGLRRTANRFSVKLVVRLRQGERDEDVAPFPVSLSAHTRHMRQHDMRTIRQPSPFQSGARDLPVEALKDAGRSSERYPALARNRDDRFFAFR